MRNVDIKMSTLKEMRDSREVRESGKTVQAYLVDWCKEHLGEEPICTRISDAIAGTSAGRIPTGLSLEFHDPKSAMTFKLTWGGI